jgi:hypothetical protein
MAFSDPQTITVNTVEKTLNSVQPEKNKTIYSTDDESFKLTLSHQETKTRTRRLARIDQRKVAADPLTSVNEYKSLGVYIVLDEPEYGFSDDEINYVVQALTGWATSANIAKLCASQH